MNATTKPARPAPPPSSPPPTLYRTLSSPPSPAGQAPLSSQLYPSSLTPSSPLPSDQLAPGPAPQGSPAGARFRPPAWQWPLLAIALAVAVFFVGRGILGLLTVDLANPGSYARDWGGPSLAGVLAVQCGPGIAVVLAAAWWRGRRVSS